MKKDFTSNFLFKMEKPEHLSLLNLDDNLTFEAWYCPI